MAQLDFVGDRPDAAELGRAWHRILETAQEVVALLPPDSAGRCALDASGGLVRSAPDELEAALGLGRIRFHPGSIRGALPTLIG